MDGSCNNANNTSWGKSNFPLQRILPPVYEDGIGSPRMTGLPTAREVSEAMTSAQVSFSFYKVWPQRSLKVT